MQEDIKVVIAAVTISALVLVGLLIILFLAFYRKRTQILLEAREQQIVFQEEIVKARNEIREQTLRNVGWELHDNIGQLLSVAKMQSYSNQDGGEEVRGTISEAINQVRGLSKSLNYDVLNSKSLTQAIANEVERYNRLGDPQNEDEYYRE